MEWFETWFNSPYYHQLYKHRDDHEARVFLDRLIGYLLPENDDTFLDLACGRGRHAIYLNQKGFHVLGTDLSTKNIDYAKAFANDRLQFAVHDMREPLDQTFDYVFNLFTSFGYFDDHTDHIRTLEAVRSSLKNEGTFVFDFLNAYRVVNDLVNDEVKPVDGIDFRIHRYHQDGKIIKQIKFEDQGKAYTFHEQVMAFSRQDILSMFQEARLEVLEEFGDYGLNPFNLESSDRLILIAERID